MFHLDAIFQGVIKGLLFFVLLRVHITIGLIYTFHWKENFCFPSNNYKDDRRKMSHLLVTSIKYLVSNTSISACISILSKISALLKSISPAVLRFSAKLYITNKSSGDQTLFPDNFWYAYFAITHTAIK